MPPHRIQLRGPWEFEPLARAELDSAAKIVWTSINLPVAGRGQMPASWQSLLGDFRGRVLFRRKFHRPTNLGPDEIVWLEFAGVGGTGTVRVNGRNVGSLMNAIPPQRFDVTALLAGNDELSVELEFRSLNPQITGGLYGSVTLEIASPDPSTGC